MNPALYDELIALRDTGATGAAMARHFGVTRRTVVRWLRETREHPQWTAATVQRLVAGGWDRAMVERVAGVRS